MENAEISYVPVKQERYRLGKVQLRRFIERKDGLAQSLMPVLHQFAKIGFSESQLEAIVDISYSDADKQGRHQKVRWFLETIISQYGAGYLKSVIEDYDKFKNFLEFLGEVEEFRSEVRCEGDGMTYDLCFSLMHELGKERADNLINILIGESKFRISRRRKGIMALYTIKELINESASTGYSPEVLLDLRRNKLGQFFEE